VLGWLAHIIVAIVLFTTAVVGAARAESSGPLPVSGVIKIIPGALLLFLAPRLWDSGSEPVPLGGRIRCGTCDCDRRCPSGGR
jgi:hypothetical protein